MGPEPGVREEVHHRPLQAVFGRIPRLQGGLLTDSNSLASTPIANDAAATAEIIRAEAIKTL